jgi:hypothetical protein
VNAIKDRERCNLAARSVGGCSSSLCSRRCRMDNWLWTNHFRTKTRELLSLIVALYNFDWEMMMGLTNRDASGTWTHTAYVFFCSHNRFFITKWLHSGLAIIKLPPLLLRVAVYQILQFSLHFGPQFNLYRQARLWCKWDPRNKSNYSIIQSNYDVPSAPKKGHRQTTSSV